MARQVHQHGSVRHQESGLIDYRLNPVERQGKSWGIRKNHADRAGCYPSVQLAVHKIAQPSKGVAKRDGNTHCVAPGKKRPLVLECPQQHSDKPADESPMIRHSLQSCPLAVFAERPENKPGLVQIQSACIVDQGRKNSGSNKKSNNTPGKKTQHIVIGDRFSRTVCFGKLSCFYLPGEQQKSHSKSHQIHKAVPAQQ